jgi:cysteine-rich repeat protein
MDVVIGDPAGDPGTDAPAADVPVPTDPGADDAPATDAQDAQDTRDEAGQDAPPVDPGAFDEGADTNATDTPDADATEADVPGVELPVGNDPGSDPGLPGDDGAEPGDTGTDLTDAGDLPEPDAGPIVPAALCRPCAQDTDCADRAGPATACVEYPGEGRFCASACDAAACPAEYDCVAVSGREGAWCVHGSGGCACSPQSVAAGRWTPCGNGNAFGTCAGRRTCTADGLSACDAATPAAETCDGTDEDCDGTTDDGSCDDGIACTEDRCSGLSGTCSHLPAVQTCLIGAGCVASGTPDPADPCRACVPNLAAVGWSFQDGAVCDDLDRCTTDDRCGAGSCAGKAVLCPDRAPECVGTYSRAWGSGACAPATGDCVHPAIDTPCVAGCDAATGLCRPDPCAGVVCTTPPDGRCYGPIGACLSGTCGYTPLDDTTPCDDNNGCTVNDTCSGAGACVPGTPKACAPVAAFCRNADRVTTTVACVPPGGACVPTETATPCAFGCDPGTAACRPDPCLGVVCATPPDTGCYGPIGACHDGTCTYTPSSGTTPCDDNDGCTINDLCGAGACVPGTPKACAPVAAFCRNADRVTTTVACVPPGGACVPAETATPCAFGCDPGTAACRPDPCLGVVCATPPSVCHQSAGTCLGGACTYAPRIAGALCDDGNPCTVGDACDAAQACLGAPKACTPAAPSCTAEGNSLQQAAGACQVPPGDCVFPSVTTPCSGGCDAATGLCNRVVASQFRTRGPTTATDEFVELFNAGSSPVDISGWKLWGSSTNGTIGLRATVPANVVMPSRGWFLFTGTGYSGAAVADAVFTTGISDNGGFAIVDTLGGIVDQVGMAALSAYKEGTFLTPLAVPSTQGYQRRTLGCGPDQDTDDNTADFVLIPSPLTHNRASCRPACAGTRCTDPAPTCADAATLTTWTATCTAGEQCESAGSSTGCPFGCDATAAACRPNPCAGQSDGTPCEDGDACSTGDRCQAGVCVTGTPLACADTDPCTADSCDAATGCVHTAQACCGNDVIDPGEDCDDGNRTDGDGCSSTCHGDCPAGTVTEAGYCWVRAATATETQAQACTRIGRAPTPPEVALTWDGAALARVAGGLGFTSAGDDGDFAPAMWCDATAGTCDTHAFGTAFYNHGPRVPAPNARPVYTCAPGNQAAVPLPSLTVHFIDVGQGDGMLLDVGTTEVLIDGGEYYAPMASYILPFVDGPIEVVMITHPHTDHYRGLLDVLNQYQVKEIWLNGATSTNSYWTELMAAVSAQEAAGAKVRVLNRSSTATAGILGFTVMHPGLALTGDVNGDSLSMRMAHGDVAFDFTGDTITASESSILAAGYTPRAQILKLAHHGSSTSTSQAWLNAVLPEVAIYSAALGNPYGHPHAEVVNRVLAMGITLLGTDTRGTIKVETSGTTYTVTTQK